MLTTKYKIEILETYCKPSGRLALLKVVTRFDLYTDRVHK
jgi:hypothetical protein